MISRWNFCKIGWYCVSSRGSNPPKTTQKGAWIGIFKPKWQNIKLAYYRNHCTDSNQMHSDKDQQMLFVGGPNTRKTNLRWRTAAILKNLKIAISRPRYDRVWRNLAWWCSSTLLTVPRVKNLKFQKSKMAAAAILKNRKIAIFWSRFDRFSRNLARWCSSNPSTVPAVKNLKFRKSKMAVAAILENLKIAISGPRYDRFWRNLAWWCSSTLLTVPRVKNFEFQKSKMAAAAIL